MIKALLLAASLLLTPLVQAQSGVTVVPKHTEATWDYMKEVAKMLPSSAPEADIYVVAAFKCYSLDIAYKGRPVFATVWYWPGKEFPFRVIEESYEMEDTMEELNDQWGEQDWENMKYRVLTLDPVKFCRT